MCLKVHDHDCYSKGGYMAMILSAFKSAVEYHSTQLDPPLIAAAIANIVDTLQMHDQIPPGVQCYCNTEG